MPTENAISSRAYKKVKLKESIISGKLTSFDNLNADEIFNEIQKGIDSFANEKTYTAKEVDQILKKEFGI